MEFSFDTASYFLRYGIISIDYFGLFKKAWEEHLAGSYSKMDKLYREQGVEDLAL